MHALIDAYQRLADANNVLARLQQSLDEFQVELPIGPMIKQIDEALEAGSKFGMCFKASYPWIRAALELYMAKDRS